VGLERRPLSLVKITEELFQGNSGSGLENRKLNLLNLLKLALTSPTRVGRSGGIVRACGLKPRSLFFVVVIVDRPLGFYKSKVRLNHWDHWEDQDVGGWTILKWILDRMGWWGLDRSGSG
jgi:hypothetical protein